MDKQEWSYRTPGVLIILFRFGTNYNDSINDNYSLNFTLSQLLYIKYCFQVYAGNNACSAGARHRVGLGLILASFILDCPLRAYAPIREIIIMRTPQHKNISNRIIR